MEIYNVLGEKVKQTFNDEYFNVKDLKSGIYLLKIYSQNNNITKKIVVK